MARTSLNKAELEEIPFGPLLDPKLQMHSLGDAALARSFVRADMQVA